MTDNEMEIRKRRFEAIDHMVREAAIDPIDEGQLVRKVLDRLRAGDERTVGLTWSALASPRMAAAGALLLAGSALVGGYQTSDARFNAVDVSLLTVAAGSPAILLAGLDSLERSQ